MYNESFAGTSRSRAATGVLPDDLERHLHEDVRPPVLVRCALVHYQFETVHLFLDGNGRLGRLLAVFHLVEQGALPQPLLSLSAHFETYGSEYSDRLQAARKRGRLQEWLWPPTSADGATILLCGGSCPGRSWRRCWPEPASGWGLDWQTRPGRPPTYGTFSNRCWPPPVRPGRLGSRTPR